MFSRNEEPYDGSWCHKETLFLTVAYFSFFLKCLDIFLHQLIATGFENAGKLPPEERHLTWWIVSPSLQDWNYTGSKIRAYLNVLCVANRCDCSVMNQQNVDCCVCVCICVTECVCLRNNRRSRQVVFLFSLCLVLKY